jgi:deoxyribodipyrimidine photo-lyase
MKMNTNKKRIKKALFIFRRDYRIHDNTSLYHAFKDCDEVLPIFIFTPEQIIETKNKYKSDKSVQFMIESLGDLEHDIKKTGGKLFIYYGEAETIIKQVIKQNDIHSLYINADYTPYSKQRDYALQELCDKMNIEFKCYHDVCLFPPGSILTGSGEIYQKFTPFYNKCIEHTNSIKKLRKPKINSSWITTNSYMNHIISLQDAYKKYTNPVEHNAVQGGREYGLKIVQSITDFKDYGKTRNDLETPTTRLSAYLKYGCISVREVYYKLLDLFSIQHDLIRQLIWRDFYIHLLDANPQVLQGKSLKPKYDKIKWGNNKEWFKAWCEGKTGFPIVDAGMRQLNETGYMHNRARLITASFLVKLLQVDWRWGEKYFAQHLVDYDPAANNGNWQWVAGSGADSQPYFRIFNPWSQAEKHDPNCVYIKRWIPELREVDVKDILNWETTHTNYICNNKSNTKSKKIKTNMDTKCLQTNYIKPIINYKEQRHNSLEMYKKVV